MKTKVKVAVIGAGSAGLYALSEVRKKTGDFLLINRGPLGTTCARVGCMPSKTLIQEGNDAYRLRNIFAKPDFSGSGKTAIDRLKALERVRSLRDSFVAGVIKSSIDPIRDRFIDGHAKFVEPGVLKVNNRTIEAETVIIATGSRPIVPEAWQEFSGQVLTSDNIFEQEKLPDSLAVIGLGPVGLELGQALHRLGIKVTGVDLKNTLAGLKDPEVNKEAIEIFRDEFPLWLGAEAEITKENGRLRVKAGSRSILVDKVLACLGRQPNTDDLGLENLGVETDEGGIPLYDRHTMQVGDLAVFIAGDVNSRRPILHEAADEGRIAGYNAVNGSIVSFQRKTYFYLTFCDPNIVEVGLPHDELDTEQSEVGEFSLGSSGRATIIGNERGLVRVYGSRKNGRLLGGALVAPGGEHLGHQLAWAVQQGMSVADILRMPFYHPTLEESLQSACRHLYRKCKMSTTGIREVARIK